MFTGLIEHIGAVHQITRAGMGVSIAVDIGPLSQGMKPGDSLSINGVCLTVSRLEKTTAVFDAVSETLSLTTLGELKSSHKVNLERALGADGRLGGHIVQGHVDGVASVDSIHAGKLETVITFSADTALTSQMVKKGSVVVDGVSLTIVDVATKEFSVALIPKTLKDTTLGSKKAGDRVNIELDIIGKYVIHAVRLMLGSSGDGKNADKDFLKRLGWEG